MAGQAKATGTRSGIAARLALCYRGRESPGFDSENCPTMLIRALTIVACAALLLAPPEAFSAEDPAAEASVATPEIAAFEQFIQSSGPVCQRQPAADCVEVGWHFADRDASGQLSLEELQAMRGRVLDWSAWRGQSLRKAERAAVTLGIWLVDSVGLDALFAGYNSDGDGGLSRQELLADVKLDQRPLIQVLRDPKAVNRKGVARRLGKLAPLMEKLMQ